MKLDNQAQVRHKAEARALKLLREWRSGKSYRQLAKKLGLSFGRVRELVRRGKDLEERDQKALGVKP